MSMSVAIPPASLWMSAMFAALAEVEKSTLCMVDLTQDSRADHLGEFQLWFNLSATSQEGPGQRVRHFVAAPTKGLSDALSGGWGMKMASGTFPVGGECSNRIACRRISTRKRCMPFTISFTKSARDTRTCCGERRYP